MQKQDTADHNHQTFHRVHPYSIKQQLTSDMVHMLAKLRHLSVFDLGESRGEAILAGSALYPLAVLSTHTEHRQL